MTRDTTKKECFVLTLRLKYNKAIEEKFDKMFRIGNNFYNSLVAEMRERLERLESSVLYRTIQEQSLDLWKLSKEGSLSKEQKEKQISLQNARSRLLTDAQFTKFGFFSISNKFKLLFGHYAGTRVASNSLDSVMCRGVANQVWRKFYSYLFDKGKNIKFRRLDDFKCIPCEDAGGIKFVGDGIVFPGKQRLHKRSKENEKQYKAQKRENNIALENGNGDSHFGEFFVPIRFSNTQYEKEALENWQERVLHCNLIRIPWKKGWLYKIQLQISGSPPVSKTKDGKKKHNLGQGRVGVDINMMAVASVGDKSADLSELGKDAYKPWKKLQEINQRMDRSRRMTNPHMFDETGQIVNGDILAKYHPECVRVTVDSEGKKHYKRLWKCSKNYLRLAAKRRYLYARFVRAKENNHKELANRILEMGDEFYTEQMDFQELQKKAKLDEAEPNKSRKRFGKATIDKSPGAFKKILKEKIEAHGGKYVEVDTYSCRASQYDHVMQDYVKHGVDERTKKVGEEIVQRDLYSAFLLQNTNDKLDGFVQEELEAKWKHFLKLQDKAMEKIPLHSPPSMAKKEWTELKG